MFKVLLKIFITVVFGSFLCAQTTGKISGKISDAKTGESIIGANVMIKDTDIGTATDENGRYFIINIQPGKYNVLVMVIGYGHVTVEDVSVSVNRTTPLDVQLNQTFLEGEMVVVKANRVSIKKDQTNTVKNISSDQIAVLPVEDIGAIVNMQAGVVAGSFRGGRNTEVTYLIDGVKVDEGFGGSSATVHIEPGTVRDLEVITGTFNAEYGKAMSGVVNQITKNGSNQFSGSMSSSYGNYLTPHSDIFLGINEPSLNENKDYKFQISGPVIKDKIYFFMNYRKRENLNHLNGIDYFNVTDSSDFSADIPQAWYSEHTGDHVMEDYCSDDNGAEVLNWQTGEEIVDEAECSEYGVCLLQFSVCVDIYGEIIEVTDDQIYCEQELNGIFGFGTDEVSHLDSEGCEYVESWINENIEDFPGFMQAVFIPNQYSVRKKNNSYVPMNTTVFTSFMGKLSIFPTSNIRMSLLYTLNDDESHWYSHYYKYSPHSRSADYNKTQFVTLHTNYMISNAMFVDAKLSRIVHDYGSYLYENPLDDRYVHDYYTNSESGFLLGGQDKDHTERTMVDNNLKIDFIWQASMEHSFKIGFDYLGHKITNNFYTIRDSTYSDEDYTPYIYSGDDVISPYKEEFVTTAYEYSGYIQDKMEFDEMVINLGLRYDYFDPNRLYPTNYRNPLNQINNVDTTRYEYADPKFQMSPRLGIGYQVGDEAVLHFSYGHFFQMPPMSAIYSNYDWLIPTGDFETILGNPNLDAEKTITYEIGLWQRLNRTMGLEVNLFYRDIYQLLSTKTITTYNTIKYGLYANKDYGNVRGMELRYDYSDNGLTVFANYTLQYTRGNADNPTMSFDREGNNNDPVNILIPMSWDQRHTLNTTITYSGKDYGMSLTGYYNSGTAYTFAPPSTNPLATINLLPNNDYKPSNYTVDMTGFYKIRLGGNIAGKFTFSVYNLLDRLNEYGVNGQTGRAYTAVIRDDERASFRSNFTNIEDSRLDPSSYSTPRLIKIGLEINF
ncbi:MAG: TonB-dependent receptor [Candidatus Marinimicrobia bacterium]|nr:TonB-dependent receptor [Candidatus Neomarinimicrobiota bacterium]